MILVNLLPHDSESKEFNVYKELRDWMNQTTMAANQEIGQSRNQRMFYYEDYTKDFTLFKMEQPDFIPEWL